MTAQPAPGDPDGRSAKPVAVATAAPASDCFGDPLPAGARARLGTVRFRPGEYVSCATLSADGKVLAVGTNRQAVVFLDAATSKELQSVKTDGSGVVTLAISPDGKKLATLGHSNRVELWEAATDRLLARFQVQGQPFHAASLTFSADGKVLAVGNHGFGKKSTVYAWQVPTGKQLGPFEPLQNHQVKVALAPDGKILATWGYYHAPGAQQDREPAQTIQFWDLATGKEQRRLRVGGTGYTQVVFTAFAPDGQKLAVATNSATIGLWDIQTGKELRKFVGRRGLGAVVQFSPDGKTLAAATVDGAVHLWETATGKRLALAEGPKCRFSSLAFVPDGRVLACGIDGQAIAVWDVTNGQVLSPATGHRQGITSLAFSKGGREVITAGNDSMVCWWDPNSGQQLRHLLVTDEESMRLRSIRSPGGLVISPDAKFMVRTYGLGGLSGIRLWETATGKALCDLDRVGASRGHKASVFSPDSMRFAVEGMDKTIHLWDVATGQELPPLKVSEQGRPVNAPGQGTLSFSPDGKSLASAGVYHDGRQMVSEVVVWDIATGKTTCRAKCGGQGIQAVTFSLDSKLIAHGEPGGVRLLNATTGKELRRLEAVDGFVHCLACSPEGRTLAGASLDQHTGTAHLALWELASGQVRCRFDGHKGRITCLAYSPDGMSLASGSADTTVLLWNRSGRSGGQTADSSRLPDELWSELAAPRAERAYRAILELAATPRKAVPLLKTQLLAEREKVPDAQDIQKLVTDLDSAQFALRDRATRRLEQLGPRAEPALLAALQARAVPGAAAAHRRVAVTDRKRDPLS
jgi:WD40 repeat protein